jgi:Tfp pilus assembly protein PilE
MNRKGLTLAEIVTVALTFAILCAVALPAYSDYKNDCRRMACKGALGAMRAAIANFHDASNSGAAFPTLAELTTCGLVLADSVPPNPFSPRERKNEVVETNAPKGTVVGSGGGWCYNPVTGEIWPNTNTPDVGENGF